MVVVIIIMIDDYCCMPITVIPVIVIRMMSPVNAHSHDRERRIIRWVIPIIVWRIIRYIDRRINILNNGC